jgi:lactate racemase
MTATAKPTYDPPGLGTEFGGSERAAVIGGIGAQLDAQQIHDFVVAQLRGANLAGKRVCLVVPDGTRTCPLPLLMRAAHEALAGLASEVTVVIALGTHQGMSEDHLARHLGYESGESAQIYPGWRILNHESWLPETFTTLASSPQTGSPS